jgi:O-antigen ligase
MNSADTPPVLAPPDDRPVRLGALRTAFVLVGGMFALQSTESLDVTKLAYLAGVLVCLIASLATVWRYRASPVVVRAVPWLAASTALSALLAVSYIVARVNGTPTVDWVRDVAAYGLFATVPVFALDAHVSAPRKAIVATLVVLGLLGGLSWAVEWVDRRQIADLPLNRLLFPSAFVPATLYVFAAASAFVSQRRWLLWVATAGVSLAFFLMTGTRSSLLMLAAPLGMAVFIGWRHWRSSARVLVAHAGIAAAIVLLFQVALTSVPAAGRPDAESRGQTVTRPPSADPLTGRLGTIPDLVESPASDPSMRERVAQYRAAWALFASSPFIGVGPGHPIVWTDVSGNAQSGWTADTPLVMPAKLGLVGIAVFIAFAIAYWATLRTAVLRNRVAAVTLALIGYGVWLVLSLPLGFLVEDKGASLGLILILALAFDQVAPELPPSPPLSTG